MNHNIKQLHPTSQATPMKPSMNVSLSCVFNYISDRSASIMHSRYILSIESLLEKEQANASLLERFHSVSSRFGTAGLCFCNKYCIFVNQLNQNILEFHTFRVHTAAGQIVST